MSNHNLDSARPGRRRNVSPKPTDAALSALYDALIERYQLGEFPNKLLMTTQELADWTGLSVRFWENRRVKGTGPPFVRISATSPRYVPEMVLDWLLSLVRNNTVAQ